jgi:pimeloyl-ACP methyl ester carboxylesterase
MSEQIAQVTDATVVDASGATVGVYTYGAADGRPVFALHGVPACGAGFDWADEPARERGIRLIAPDRPGVGRSAQRPDWQVADYPAMLASLADALEIDRFAVLGYSGGGPYAVACAVALADRVTSVAVCAGMGEVGTVAAIGDFESTDRRMLAMSTKRPRLARVVLDVSAMAATWSPKLAMKSFLKELSATDREVAASLGSPVEAMRLFTMAFQEGAHGVVADYRAVARRWGVDPAAVTVPVTVWHGSADTMVPLRHSQELAAMVPGSVLTVWEGEGHLATVTHIGDVLDALT